MLISQILYGQQSSKEFLYRFSLKFENYPLASWLLISDWLLCRLLVQMTLPVGCLVSGETATNQRNAAPSESRVFVHELSQFLYNAKETFALNPLATRSIFEHLNCLLANVTKKNDDKLLKSSIYCDFGILGSAAATIKRRLRIS